MAEIRSLKSVVQGSSPCGSTKNKIIHDDGSDVEMNGQFVQEFEYTGLSNIHIITTGFYKTGFDEYVYDREE